MTVTIPSRGHITHDIWRQCSVDGCPLVYRALGMCDSHYRQQRRREKAVQQWTAPAAASKRRRVSRGGIVRWEAIT